MKTYIFVRDRFTAYADFKTVQATNITDAQSQVGWYNYAIFSITK